MAAETARSEDFDSLPHVHVLPDMAVWSDGAYPSVLAGAEAASAEGRSRFMWLSQAELALAVGTSMLAIVFLLGDSFWWETGERVRGWERVALAVAVIVSFVVKIGSRLRQYDAQWFEARAVAETVKSMTWRYVTRADPFQGSGTDQQVDVAFHAAIRTTLRSSGAFHPRIYQELPISEQITPEMVQIRSRDLDERRKIFIQDRLDDQISWYSNKAARSERISARWFWLGLGLTAMALVAAIVSIQAFWVAVLISLFATLATATTVLSKLGRHDDIKKSYVLAAYELSFLRERVLAAVSEDELSEAVEASEEAISREHSMWIARQ